MKPPVRPGSEEFWQVWLSESREFIERVQRRIGRPTAPEKPLDPESPVDEKLEQFLRSRINDIYMKLIDIQNSIERLRQARKTLDMPPPDAEGSKGDILDRLGHSRGYLDKLRQELDAGSIRLEKVKRGVWRMWILDRTKFPPPD